MSGRDLAFVGLRLIAIYLALNVIYSIAGVAESLFAWRSGAFGAAEGNEAFLYYGLTSTLLYLILSIVLWVGASPISNAVAPETIGNDAQKAISVRSLQAIVFSAVGLFVLVNALPKLAGELYKVHQISSVLSIPPEMSFADKARRVQVGIEAIFGLSLLLGGGALSGLLVRLREFGLPSENSGDARKPRSR